MAGNAMGEFEWARHEERVAALPGVVDIGVGRDLVRASGLTPAQLGALIRDVFHQLIDGGGNVVNVAGPGGALRAYVRRRGRSVDVGTRRDFLDLGWGAICDLLDRSTGASS